ncbi:MAG: hypothetical protein MPW15_07850 [Candidatus Manganitrophus sp.]|nr:hypothetical protein [Candidatus Manganitrophus sp.]
MKVFPSHIGLRLKLTLPVVLLILVIMFSISFLFGLRHEQTLRGEMKRRAVRIAQTAGTMSMIPLPGIPAWTLSKNFVPLVPQLDPNVLYVVVFDEFGKVQAASTNQPLLKALLNREEIASAEKELISEVTETGGASKGVSPDGGRYFQWRSGSSPRGGERSWSVFPLQRWRGRFLLQDGRRSV